MSDHYSHYRCRVTGVGHTLPDCTDPATLDVFDADSVAEAIQMCEYTSDTILITKIYFSITVINSIYVILTTGLFVYRAKSVRSDNDRFAIDERRKQLSKRYLPALVVGSIGNLMVSSIFTIIQGMNGCLYCPLLMYLSCYGYLLWIASYFWRAYYLRFKFKLDRAKLQLASGQSKKEHEWFLRNKDQHAISTARFVKVILLIMIVAFIPLILIHRFYYGFDSSNKDCANQAGTIVLVCFVSFFSCVMTPALILSIRKFADAHNVRNELIVIGCISVPTSIMYVIWITIIPSSYDPYSPRIRLYFGSINWIVVKQLAAHFITVTYPLLASYGFFGTSKSMRRSSSSLTDASAPHRVFECNMASLEYIVRQPELLDKMREVAVQDFSAEYVLFCEQYQILEAAVSAKLGEYMPPHGLPDCPIPPELVSKYIAFYNTFIAEGSPLQINIAQADKQEVDNVFASYASQGEVIEQAISKIPVQHNWWAWSSTQLVPNTQQVQSQATEQLSVTDERMPNEKYPETVIPCNIFDGPRKEVMWILFCNILPKFIETCKIA
ncbi:hypothetical protein NQZ79_g360 [Umbelopsis isabellina]|nr:hypothetical protein NQZ79_g360 [Umbelopsis isabellina]